MIPSCRAEAPRTLRQIRLQLVVAMRAGGFVPWLLLLGFCLVAAVQEPLMLRNFGVYLVAEGSWISGSVVLLLLALQLPATRNRSVRIVAACTLALGLAVVHGAVPFVFDGLRRQTWEVPIFARSVLWFWIANIGLTLSAASWTRRSWALSVHLVVQVLLAAAGASRLQVDGCSWSWLLASIAAAVAALVMATSSVAANK